MGNRLDHAVMFNYLDESPHTPSRTMFPVPEATARIAYAAFRKENLFMRMRDNRHPSTNLYPASPRTQYAAVISSKVASIFVSPEVAGSVGLRYCATKMLCFP